MRDGDPMSCHTVGARAAAWMLLLGVPPNTEEREAEIIKYDLSNQRVIKADIERTLTHLGNQVEIG